MRDGLFGRSICNRSSSFETEFDGVALLEYLLVFSHAAQAGLDTGRTFKESAPKEPLRFLQECAFFLIRTLVK